MNKFNHHMQIAWNEFGKNKLLIKENLRVKTAIIGRVGTMMMSCGTGAWRVRESMNTMARTLNIKCTADIGLVSLGFTCYEKGKSYTEALTLPDTGINMIKLNELENFVKIFQIKGPKMTTTQVNHLLDKIQKISNDYSDLIISLAAGSACSAFVFLLGGGYIEMLCCLLAAALGSLVRKKMNEKHIIFLMGIMVSVAVSCISYAIIFNIIREIFHVSVAHQAGYIGAILFVIPGFPFITSGLDIAKIDLRSGIERLTYALIIILIAALIGWIVALTLHLKPLAFVPLKMPMMLKIILDFCASFIGVYGFSLMFNSNLPMALMSAFIGALANTLRLSLMIFTLLPPSITAFIGALTAGLLASFIQRYNGYPRIAITVPSIVIMVPGLYFYRAFYEIGNIELQSGMNWLVKAFLIIIFLPLGLVVARLLTDNKWRYTN